uniref:Uncharacterized protein n=1 Tax=Arundo donax TaxID=35708 RepID=A0A0A9AD98_ARUDO
MSYRTLWTWSPWLHLKLSNAKQTPMSCR